MRLFCGLSIGRPLGTAIIIIGLTTTAAIATNKDILWFGDGSARGIGHRLPRDDRLVVMPFLHHRCGSLICGGGGGGVRDRYAWRRTLSDRQRRPPSNALQ